MSFCNKGIESSDFGVYLTSLKNHASSWTCLPSTINWPSNMTQGSMVVTWESDNPHNMLTITNADVDLQKYSHILLRLGNTDCWVVGDITAYSTTSGVLETTNLAFPPTCFLTQGLIYDPPSPSPYGSMCSGTSQIPFYNSIPNPAIFPESACLFTWCCTSTGCLSTATCNSPSFNNRSASFSAKHDESGNPYIEYQARFFTGSCWFCNTSCEVTDTPDFLPDSSTLSDFLPNTNGQGSMSQVCKNASTNWYTNFESYLTAMWAEYPTPIETVAAPCQCILDAQVALETCTSGGSTPTIGGLVTVCTYGNDSTNCEGQSQVLDDPTSSWTGAHVCATKDPVTMTCSESCPSTFTCGTYADFLEAIGKDLYDYCVENANITCGQLVKRTLTMPFSGFNTNPATSTEICNDTYNQYVWLQKDNTDASNIGGKFIHCSDSDFTVVTKSFGGYSAADGGCDCSATEECDGIPVCTTQEEWFYGNTESDCINAYNDAVNKCVEDSSDCHHPVKIFPCDCAKAGVFPVKKVL